MYNEHCASSSFERYCVNCLFTRWCWVMVHAHWFAEALQGVAVVGDVGHWQPSVTIQWRSKRVIWVEKRFCILFKSLSHESWNLTPSFCFSFGFDMQGTGSVTQRPAPASVDLNSNMPVSAALKTCLWDKARKYVPSIHPSFWEELRGLH